MSKINVVTEIRELKNHLSYSKNIGFFFGAGTSCALDIPNIEQLTTAVESALKGGPAKSFQLVKKDLESSILDRTVNIEDILNHIRRIREITGEKSNKSYQGVTGAVARQLDKDICANIYAIILEKETKADLVSTKRFLAWLSMFSKDFSKEIFTTNYDLVIERSLEAAQIPYFDGFVGSYEPFFWQDSIDRFVTKNDLTQSWIRLWKVHGSLSWFWKWDKKTKTPKIVRIGRVENVKSDENELVIYPSKEKYDSSRKQPFVAYFDRFKNYLSNGELLFVFSGYSFCDQHINEIVFNSLRQNNRLSALIFFFKDEEVESLHQLTSSYMNLTVFGPTKAIINGNLGEWEFSKTDLKPTERYDHYWDDTGNRFKLGNFVSLVDFLITNSGKKEAIESATK